MNKNTKKTSSETGFKSTITLGVMIIFMLFLTGFVSAWEWDNVKIYDIETKTATITNAFNFPLISSKIAEIQLKSEQEVQVGLGYQKVFEYEISSLKDYANFIQEVEIYNIKDGNSKEDKKVDLKYLAYENVEVNDYKEICNEIEKEKNGTIINNCSNELIGKHTETREVWKDLDSFDLKIGTKRISGWTNVEQGDYYEWVPNFAGVKVSEWATWIQTLNDDFSTDTLASYIKTGTITYDATNDRVIVGANGSANQGTMVRGNFTEANFTTDFNLVTGGYQNILFYTDGNFGTSTGSGYMVGVGTSWNSAHGGMTIFHSTGGLNGRIALGTDTGYTLLAGTDYRLETTKVGTNLTAKLYTKSDNTLRAIVSVNDGNRSYGYNGYFSWDRAFYYIDNYIISYEGISDNPPTITLNAPTNATLSQVSLNTFNCTATDDKKVQNITFYLNNAINQTNSSVFNNTLTTFSVALPEGAYTWNCGACDNATTPQCVNGTARTFTLDTTPFIEFVEPTHENNSNLSVPYIPVNVSLTETYFKNVTFNFYKGGVLNESVTFTDGTRFYNKTGCTCDNWEINVTTCTTTNKCNSTETRKLTIDTVYPIVNTAQNITNLFVSSLPTNSTWNYTATDSHISTCYYNTTDHAETIVTCNSSINTKWATEGNKQITYCANDTFGLETCNTISVRVANYPYSHSTDKSIVGEGDAVTFTLRVNGTDINTEFASTNATLSFNGVVYSPDTTTKTAQNYSLFEKTLSIPSGSGNSTGAFLQFNWTYNIKNTSTTVLTQTTNTSTLKVLNVSITDCGVTAGRIILNMSLKDEETRTLVNATAPNVSRIEVDLTISSETNSSQTWNFHKQWDNENTIAVCVPNELLNETSYNIEILAGYESTDHVREFWYLENGTLDDTGYFNAYTFNVLDLFNLASADSTTFLFSFTNTDGLEVDDAIIHTFRKYIGAGRFEEVERSKQDNNGETHVHLVEEDVIYYFMITQYGTIIYTSDEYNAKCLSTPCAITLTASPTETNWSMIDNEGGLYSITADKSTRIVNLNFDLGSSDLVNFSLYKFTDGTAELVNTSYLTASTGSIDLTVPLSYGNSTFFVSVFRNNSFVKSEWVSLKESGKDYFGTFGAVLGGFLVLAIMLMAVSEGAGFIVFTAFALIIIGIMQLVDLTWLAIGSIICAGGVIVYKLIKRRNKNG